MPQARPTPRRARRRLAGVAALVGAAALPATAGASIVVTGMGTEAAPDGVCVLVEAVANANGDDTSGSADCAPGSGADTITFGLDGDFPTAGLPPLAGALTISGAGRDVTLRGSSTARVLLVPAGATLTVHRVEVSGGTAVDCPGVSPFLGCGGGVFNAGSLTLLDSHVTGNDAGTDGVGGGVFNLGTATVSRSAVSANGARTGGGIADLGTLTVSDSTIAGNRGADAGGGLHAAGSARITGSTITGNISATPKDPVSIATSEGGAVVLANTVVEGTPGAVNCAGDGTVTTAGTVVAFPAAGCPGTVADPRLGALGMNGGPTPTALPGPGSPLIDAGDPAFCSSTDQRLVVRPQGTGCDVGAVEVVPRDLPDTTPPVVTPAVDGPRGLRGWFVGDVTVSWDVEDPESGVTSTDGCDATRVTRDTGGTTFTCVAEGPGGRTSRSVTVRRDATAPVVSLVNPVAGARYTVGQTVVADYACADGTSGTSSCEGTTPAGAPLDTKLAGQRTWQVVARDEAGNVAVTSADHAVGFAYSGLLGAVKPPPRVNQVVAGSTVVLRFRLGGDQGRDVLDDDRPATSASLSCRYADKGPYGTPRPAAFRLGYEAPTATYSLRWYTSRRWAGQCRELVMRLADGRAQRVLVSFRPPAQ